MTKRTMHCMCEERSVIFVGDICFLPADHTNAFYVRLNAILGRHHGVPGMCALQISGCSVFLSSKTEPGVVSEVNLFGFEFG